MPMDFSPPFLTLAEAAASRPSPEQMQRINFYGSLCQAPDCSHGVGCSYPAAPWGSWEERLVGDARAPGQIPKAGMARTRHTDEAQDVTYHGH